MRKTKSMKSTEAQKFVEAVKRQFPFIRYEYDLEPFEGWDLVIKLIIPETQEEKRDEVISLAHDLRWQIHDKTGIGIATMTVVQEPEGEAVPHG